MAYTNIDDPSAYFQTATYTGNGSATNAITNDGNSDLQPDFVWVKRREGASDSVLQDSSRGFTSTTKLASSSNQHENDTNSGGSFGITDPQWGYVSSASSDGFNANVGTGTGDQVNKTSSSYVAWQWKANGGTTASNSVGDITSTVQANTDAGFSIVTYTGNGNQDQTIGHGLGAVPKMILFKNRSNAAYWYVYHIETGNDTMTYLNLTNAAQSLSSQFSTPTTTTFNVSNENSTFSGYNTSGNTYVAYVFADVQGYSKFGKYTGNGSGTSDGTFDGTFVYTGFSPSFLMIKRSDGGAEDWNIFDNKRPPRGGSTTDGNYINNKLYANSTSAESGNVYDAVDFLSNGFKIRTGRGGTNTSGGTYIYMAFASSPFTSSSGIPTTAR